jgi:probable F420-dependent oxidoreductase
MTGEDGVEFGISMSRIDDIAGFARRHEELGFDYLAVGEHVFFHVPISNGFVSLAVAAGATERIKLLTTITLLPLYPAALAAKLGASLDVASGGRFHLGVGVGGEFRKEFEALGVPVEERGARTDEALEVITRLWSEDDVHFEGRFTTLPGVTLDPKPVQRPRPPIWVAGRTDAAMRRTARYGDGWLPYMYTPEMLIESRQKIDALRAEAGRTDPVRAGLFVFFAVDADGDRAREMAIAQLSRQYDQDFSRLVGKYAIAGDPDDCIARLSQYLDAGARTVVLASACPPAHVAENHRLMAEEVVPALRQRKG